MASRPMPELLLTEDMTVEANERRVLEICLMVRKRDRKVRQEAARKGWQTRRAR